MNLKLTILICFLSISSVFASDTSQKTPELMLAKTYQAEINEHRLQDYWVSEKLDGVRAYWNGSNFI